jgi:glycosyltransferase involved in cell wall biosynthesis
LPLKKPKPVVVTIHDVIPLVFPEYYPCGIKGTIKFQIQKLSLKGAKAVITDSENSKKDLFKYLNYPKEKIYVIPLAPSDIFKPVKSTILLDRIKVKYNLPEKFVLYVGDLNYNKNISGLIRAFYKLKTQNSKLKTTTKNLKLVLVGKAFTDESLKETQQLVQLIKSLGLNDKIIRLGWIPTKDLVGIYNLATVYCQPSFYEGFGLPVLEAMACGCPVVAANTSSLPEICGEAALMVDPYDINDIVRGISKVISDKAIGETLRKNGFNQVKKFSWKKVANETYKVYQKVVQG